jgi:MFS family permease
MIEQDPRDSTRKPRRGLHYGLVVLGLIILTVFGSLGLARFGYTSILPAMQDNLGLTNAQTGELQSWNLTGYLLTVVFAGLLAVRFGPRITIFIALIVTGLAMILTGLIPTFNGARLGRFLAGVGGAGANVPAMALVSAWFGMRRRGLAAGAGVTGSSLGLMVTGPLIPALLTRFGPDGWRACWYVLGTIALIISGLCLVFLRNRPHELGLSPVGDVESGPAQSEAEKRQPAPGWGSVWRSGTLWHLAAVYFAFGFSYIIYATFFIRYLVREGGFRPTEAGLLWLQIGMISVISGFIWGAVSDRWGRRLALLGVFLLQGVSFLMLGTSRGGWAVYASAGLFALTAWSIPALMAALSGDVFGPRLAPAALGLMTIVFGFGQALGPYVAGRIADTTHSFQLAFVLAGVIALALGAGLSLSLRLQKKSGSHLDI